MILYLLAVLGTILTALGQVFLKMYSTKSKTVSFFKKLTDKNILLSVFSFGFTIIINIYVLKFLDFTVFYAFTSLTFVFVTLFSKLLLKEVVDFHKSLGVVIIIVGLSIFNL